MKLIKCNSKMKFLESEPFNFKRVRDLKNFKIFTSYLKGMSPEYESDIDKLLMVIEGKVQLTTENMNTELMPGDLIQILSGEKYRINAKSGAKLLQLTQDLVTKEVETNLVKKIVTNRHSIRNYLDKHVPKNDIYYIMKVGMLAPSAVNRQSWKYIVVSDPETKRKIREAAEKVEKKYYQQIQNQDKELNTDLSLLGLSWKKPFLERAPYLICIFSDRTQPYHKESVWLATGWMLLAAEELGLSTLTYTPNKFNFLNQILDIKDPFKPELIMPVGYAAKKETEKKRKDINEVVTWI